MALAMAKGSVEFQSTPSARRATVNGQLIIALLRRFQSTPSARRATIRHEDAKEVGKISIHALREESDW